MELGNRIVTVSVGSIAATVIAGLMIQHSVIRQEGIDLIRDTMRVTLISAENTRNSVSAMRIAGDFDEAKLKDELKQVSDFRQSSVYPTVPVVAAWNSITDIAEKQHYVFRIPAHNPRNPKNLPSAEEETILRKMEAEKLPEYFEVNEASGEILYARPILLGNDCMSCHGSPLTSPTHDGKDVLGFRMEGWHPGDMHGIFLLRSKLDRVNKVVQAGLLQTLCWLLPLSIAIGIGVYFIISKTSNRLRELTNGVSESASRVSSAAAEISSASQTLAQGATEQVASLEETSAAVEQITGMTRTNADNSRLAAAEMDAVSQHVDSSNAALGEMISSMQEIKDASGQISKIIKVIDNISFQTNILALNAAVEAARAGDSGAGFAVVAEEVRSLALRSAQAAKDTGLLIETSLEKSNAGNAKLQQVVGVFQGIAVSATKVKGLIDQVNTGSQEQRRGIEQVLGAIHQMEKITQATASNSEQGAATSGELSAQAAAMTDIAHNLRIVVEG